MEENNWLDRTEKLIGTENIVKLKNSTIAVCGIGGVGSYVVEGLSRSGVGNLVIIDNDIVDVTNINRQLIATSSTIGMPKVEVAAKRLIDINPDINITTIREFISKDTISQIFDRKEIGLYS